MKLSKDEIRAIVMLTVLSVFLVEYIAVETYLAVRQNRKTIECKSLHRSDADMLREKVLGECIDYAACAWERM